MAMKSNSAQDMPKPPMCVLAWPHTSIPRTVLTWAFPQTHPQEACMVPLSSWSLLPGIWKETNSESRVQLVEVPRSR